METVLRDNLKPAVAAILIACLALSLGDALIKQHSGSFVIWQIFIVRSGLAIPFLIYWLRMHSCNQPLRPTQLGWTLARSLILVLMWISYFIALPHIQFAIAAAAYYTLPIFITLFAAIFLGERIGLLGWSATTLGFIGCLLILQPQVDEFNAYALLPIVSAICYAGAMILTRSKCRSENPILLSLWLNLCFVAVGVLALLALSLWEPTLGTVATNPFLLGDWTPMRLEEWRLMAMLAIVLIIGSVCAAYAYQWGRSSAIATFDFSYVVFAVIWGYLIFEEIPTLPVATGIIIIAIAGTFATRAQSA